MGVACQVFALAPVYARSPAPTVYAHEKALCTGTLATQAKEEEEEEEKNCTYVCPIFAVFLLAQGTLIRNLGRPVVSPL